MEMSIWLILLIATFYVICAQVQSSHSVWSRQRYLLYDINHVEGFNLRRDVYLRIAVLVHHLQRSEAGSCSLSEACAAASNTNWVLVLPPWNHMYHWRSTQLGAQTCIPWKQFFDVESLRAFIPVMEFSDFVREESTNGEITHVYSLQHYPDTFTKLEEDGVWEDKADILQCDSYPALPNGYAEDEFGLIRGWFWGCNSLNIGVDIRARNLSCISVQGPASVLIPHLQASDAMSVLLDRAEIVLHDTFGSAEYWRARRSMRFSETLREAADVFRRDFLNSTDDKDRTTLVSWEKMKRSDGDAIGGPYLAVHLRRGDFAHRNSCSYPNISAVIEQLTELLLKLKLQVLFIATDANKNEVKQLLDGLRRFQVHRFIPAESELNTYLDGGVAIIDQWICAHARYFIGSHESTFSFRIQEEREILGFHPDTTFNRLCGKCDKSCQPPSRWRIVY